jgi:hypothetical protein
VKLSADLEVKKDMELKKFWARQDYTDRVINECLSKIESEGCLDGNEKKCQNKIRFVFKIVRSLTGWKDSHFLK